MIPHSHLHLLARSFAKRKAASLSNNSSGQTCGASGSAHSAVTADGLWQYLLITLIGILVGCELSSLIIGPPQKAAALSTTLFAVPPATDPVVADQGGRLMVEIAPNSDANHSYWDCALMARSQGETHFGFAARGVWDKDRYRIDVTCAIGSQGKGSRFVMHEKELPLNAVTEWKP